MASAGNLEQEGESYQVDSGAPSLTVAESKAQDLALY
jgi:hypothetical protein